MKLFRCQFGLDCHSFGHTFSIHHLNGFDTSRLGLGGRWLSLRVGGELGIGRSPTVGQTRWLLAAQRPHTRQVHAHARLESLVGDVGHLSDAHGLRIQ
jgi:hypothetical protein